MQKPPTNPTPKSSKIYICPTTTRTKNGSLLFGAKVCICCQKKKLWAFFCGKFNDFLNFLNYFILF